MCPGILTSTIVIADHFIELALWITESFFHFESSRDAFFIFGIGAVRCNSDQWYREGKTDSSNAYGSPNTCVADGFDKGGW